MEKKPLELVRRIIDASTGPGDVVWEPFDGLCTGAVAAKQLGREARAAEIVDEYYEAAVVDPPTDEVLTDIVAGYAENRPEDEPPAPTYWLSVESPSDIWVRDGTVSRITEAGCRPF